MALQRAQRGLQVGISVEVVEKGEQPIDGALGPGAETANPLKLRLVARLL